MRNDQELQRSLVYVKPYFKEPEKTSVQDLRNKLKSITTTFILYIVSLTNSKNPGIQKTVSNKVTW